MFPIFWAGFGTFLVRLPGGHRARSLTPLHMIHKLLELYLRPQSLLVNLKFRKNPDHQGDSPVKYFDGTPIIGVRKMKTSSAHEAF